MLGIRSVADADTSLCAFHRATCDWYRPLLVPDCYDRTRRTDTEKSHNKNETAIRDAKQLWSAIKFRYSHLNRHCCCSHR